MTPFSRLSVLIHSHAILVDVTGLVIYFSIALLIMRGAVL
jgi:Mg/Co/Ni transporter MgtE